MPMDASFFEMADRKVRQATEAAESAMEWKAQQEAEKAAREEEMAANMRQLAEDSENAKRCAVEAGRRSNMAIGIAIASALVSILMSSVAIFVAHHDSETTTRTLVEAIGSLKGVSK